MGLSIADQYYVKAFDNYPFEIENTVENLSYALSYDEHHVQANCLMGQVQMYIFKDFKEATNFFEQALVSSLDYPDTYKHYSRLKIWLGEFDSAWKLINYAMKVKGMHKGIMLRRKATICEFKGDFESANAFLNDSKIYSTDTESTEFIEKEIKRIKVKMKEVKKNKPTRSAKRARR